MHARVSSLALILLASGLPAASPAAVAAEFPSRHPDYPPPEGYEGRLFALSQDYPAAEPAPEDQPWLAIDFEAEPFLYLGTVLQYGLEGNVEADWEVAENTVRTWYHAPWMHTGCGGRELVRGMTRERSSRPGELHPAQTEWTDNWAVGMYNPPGGFTLGQVWLDPLAPDPAAAQFPIGTVAIKLLFTTATVEEVPYLEGSLQWQAHVYPKTSGNPCNAAVAERPRVMRDLLLFQLDVAVRDERATETGWVFGTFVYDASAEGDTPFERLVPVGVSWGNDPTVQTRITEAGAFVNQDLVQNVVNADLIRSGDWPDDRAFVTHFGLGGRVNGPIDNPISSCTSCHGLAAQPSQPVVARVGDPADYTLADFTRFFANVPPGPVDAGDFTRLDYSLQLAFGIRAFAVCAGDPSSEGCSQAPGEPEPPPPAPTAAPAERRRVLQPGEPISREGPAMESIPMESIRGTESPAPAAEEPEDPVSSGSPAWVWGLLIVALVAAAALWIKRR